MGWKINHQIITRKNQSKSQGWLFMFERILSKIKAMDFWGWGSTILLMIWSFSHYLQRFFSTIQKVVVSRKFWTINQYVSTINHLHMWGVKVMGDTRTQAKQESKNQATQVEELIFWPPASEFKRSRFTWLGIPPQNGVLVLCPNLLEKSWDLFHQQFQGWLFFCPIHGIFTYVHLVDWLNDW